MKNNPFLSNTFISVWLKHFNGSNHAVNFKFITGISFVKNKYLPLYVNVGKNLTNGISYSLRKNETDYQKKVFFIYDIPEYFNVKNNLSGSLKLKPIRQYKGYLVNLEKYKNTDDYLKTHLSSNSRWKINKSLKRLETCLNIKYGVFFGSETIKKDFDFAFQYFNNLLKKRFTEKQINNHYLVPKKWTYLQDLIYQMILEEKAALFVIYSDNIPISVYLNYVSPSILYSALPVFDPDYSKFNLGYIDNLKHIDWCYKHNIKVFDFSKGDYDYKKRLGNKEYYFDYHILYDSKSISAIVLSQSIFLYFKGKQFLRDLNIHILFHKVIFFLKGSKYKQQMPLEFEVIKLESIPAEERLSKLNHTDEQYEVITKVILDFLYKNSESINNIDVYKIEKSLSTYIIKGKNNIEKVIIK